MGLDDKDQVKFISSLDFDISKVNDTMNSLNSIFDKNMKELEKKVKESTANINNLFSSIGGIKIDSGGLGSPQQAAKEINKNLANVMANAVKHLNMFLDKVGQEVYEMEVRHEFSKDLENIDKEIAKYVKNAIYSSSKYLEGQFAEGKDYQRIPFWARTSDRNAMSIDEMAEAVHKKFGVFDENAPGGLEEGLKEWFDNYEAYHKTKKDLLYDISETTQALAKAKDYADKSIDDIMDNLTKNLETILDPKELEKFKGLSFEEKRNYLVNMLQKYKLTLDGIGDEGTKRLSDYIDALTEESGFTTTKSDIVKQAVNNLKVAQENLQKRVTKIIDDDIKSISETFKQSELETLKITRQFDKDGNVTSIQDLHTEDRTRLQAAAYKDLLNLTKQIFNIDKQRVGASEEQLKVINETEEILSQQYVDVGKIIGAYGLQSEELQKNLEIEEKKLGNAVRLKEIKHEEKLAAKELAIEEEKHRKFAKAATDERKRQEAEAQRLARQTNKEWREQFEYRIKMEKSLPKMEASVAVAQQTIKTKELSAELGKQAATLRQQIKLMQEKLVKEGQLTKEEVAQTKEMQEQLSLLQQQVKTAGADKPLQPTVRESPFMARTQTALSYKIIYEAIRGMKEALSTIQDVEMGITEIARVSGDASFNFDKVRDSIIQLGVEYGQTFENVQHIALRWVQSGYEVNDALELTKTSLLALNTAELDVKDATESMIGIMAQWNLETKDLSTVLDKINKVADSFSLTSQDLVDGLLRASGAAKVMGLDIDHTIALLTAMREASGRTGREVGNALNSILSYIQRAKSIDVLESMGIRMFADEARKEFRNVFEVFSELADKWKDPNIAQGAKDALMAGAQEAGLFAEELAEVVGMQDEHIKMIELETKATEEYTDVQKRDAAQAAAGIFRRNYFIGLLERFETTYKALNVASEAEGYSMRENARTMETLEKKIQSLKTAYVQLAVAIGDAGLLDVAKNLGDTMKDWVNYFAQLDSPMKNFIINLGLVLGSIKAAKLTASLFGLEEVVAALGGLVSMPVAATLVGITAALITLRSRLKEVAKEKERLLEGSQETVAEIESTDRLITKYEELSEKVRNNSEAKGELVTLQKQLAEIYPEYVDYVDEEGNSLVTNIGLLKEQNRLKAEELELKRQELADEAPFEIEKLEKKKASLEKRIKDIDKLMAQGWKTNLLEQDYLEVRGVTVKKLQDVNKQLAQYSHFLNKQEDDYDRVERARLKAIGAIDAETGALKDNSGALSENTALTEEQIQANEKWTKAFNSSISNMQAYEGMLRELNSQEGLSVRSKQDIITKYQQFLPYLSNENALREQLLIAIDNEDKAQQKMYLSKIENDETFYETMLTNNEIAINKLQEGYEVDLDHYKSLAEAKRQIDILWLREASERWSRYYDIHTDTMKEYKGSSRLLYTDSTVSKVIKAVEKLRSFNKELDNIALKGVNFRGAGDFKSRVSGSGSTANTALQEYLRLLEHRKRMDELSIQEEIKGYEYALKHYAKTANEKMDLEEKIFALKKSLIQEEKKLVESVSKTTESTLSEEMKSIKDAYDKRIQMIDDELDLKKKAQQEIIDGINEEIEAMNRKEKGITHEQRLADLNEKLKYHQMRTGIEHERAIADIEKQIAEENRTYQNEQILEGLRDKKQIAEDEIKDLEKNATKQKTVLKKSLDSFEELFNGSNKSIIASAMAMSEEYAGIVDGMINRAKQAILESDLTDEIEFEGFGEVAKVAERGKESQDIKSYVAGIVDYKQMYSVAANAGKQADMTKAYEGAKRFYSLLEKTEKGKGFAEQLRKMNYEQAKKLLETATFHTGGKNVKEGLALLKRNEIVLNPRLSEAFERFSISLMRNPTQTSIDNSRSDSRNVTVDKAVNIENAYFEDEADIEIFGREVKRVVGALP